LHTTVGAQGPSNESPDFPWKACTFSFLGIPLLALLVVHFAGLDEPLALRLFDPKSSLANLIREYSPRLTWALGLGLVVASLLAWLVPGWRRFRRPMLGVSLGWLLLALFSLVVLSEGLGKQYFDRARPRETAALGGPMAYQPMFTRGQAFNGQSQVSSHAVAATLCAALYFFVFPYQRRLARVLWVVGLPFAVLVGYGRMVSGAHFLSDVLLSWLLTMAAAMAMLRISAMPGRRTRAAAATAALLLVGWAYADFALREARPWRALDQALAGGEGGSVTGARRQYLALRRLGWRLHAPGATPAPGAYATPGAAGLREALASLPPGTRFRLALVDTTPFDSQGFGGIRAACDRARVAALSRVDGQPPDVQVYEGVVGQAGTCPGQPFAYVDTPLAYAPVSGVLAIRGWAVDPASEIVAVELMRDGVSMGAVEFKVRPLEAGASFTTLAVPLSSIAMLSATLSLEGIPAGWHSLSLKVTNAGGRSSVTPPTLVKIGE
jgi:membrane-associated phospholipid phosphatase